MKTKTLLLVLLISFIGIKINAQIIYIDITDGIPSGIDFNSDGTNEFDISKIINPGDYITYSSYGADNNIHALGTTSTQNWDVPDCEAIGFTIGASNQWEGQGDCSIDGWGMGNSSITFNQDEYLCVRFNLGGTDVYYGWIRFSMNNQGVIVYKDFAYNSTPEQSITAGQITLSINKPDFSNEIKLYPNPAKQVITIENSSQSSISSIIIRSLVGKEVLVSPLINNTTTIDISSLSSGLYIINLFDNSTLVGIKQLIIK